MPLPTGAYINSLGCLCLVYTGKDSVWIGTFILWLSPMVRGCPFFIESCVWYGLIVFSGADKIYQNLKNLTIVSKLTHYSF